jgi:cleavage and polyadenylation specificity factor subunit 1
MLFSFFQNIDDFLVSIRMVKNDSVSRAITKGILDGELLAEFERLPFDQQMEITNSIKTDPDTVLLNLRDLAAW